MSVTGMIAAMGTDVVLRRRADDGSLTETPVRCLMHNEARKATFAVDSPVGEGDEIVVVLPDGREKVHHVVEVHHQLGATAARSAVAVWTTTRSGAAAAPSGSTGTLGLSLLHPLIQEAAGRIFDDGHYAQAVFEAVKSVEVRVRELAGMGGHGTALMSKALGSGAVLALSTEPGQSGKDEQEGFKLLFMGAMLALKNPRSHGLVQQDERTALESLAFLSLLMRRLDDPTPPTPDVTVDEDARPPGAARRAQ